MNKRSGGARPNREGSDSREPDRGAAGRASGTILSVGANACQAAMDALDAGVLVFDSASVCVFANPRAASLLGVAEQETLIGTRVPDDLVEDVAKTLRAGTTERREQLALARRDGRGEAWVSTSVTPTESGAVITLVDVSARRAADEENAFRKILLQAQSDASLDAILVVSPGSEFISYNRRFIELWGVPDDIVESGSDADALKMVLGKLVDPEGFISRVQHLYEHPNEESRDEIAMLDGRTIDRYSAPVRDASGRYYGRVWFFRDVTELARATAERERILAREKDARLAAEEASRAKDEFLAVVSHELRTPLTAVLGWSRLLRRPGRSEAERERALGIIERNALVQAKLIEDLLDVSRVITGKIRLNVGPVELSSIVSAAVESLQPAAAARAIKVTTSLEAGSALTTGDEARLQQVAFNLVTNAIKFTPESGHVTISLRRHGNAMELAVEDDGIGIEPEFLPRVFERFCQADANPTTRSHGGLGLGLAIVRHLVELHGGTVTAESKGRGLGSRFTVRLPVRALSSSHVKPREQGERLAPGQPPSAQMPDLDGVRVLFVDDHADARELLADLLGGCGARVTTVPGADDALAALGNEVFDVVVSDLSMPGKDGYAFIAQLRSTERDAGRRAMPAVALSAMAADSAGPSAKLAGFDVLLTKPAEPVELAQTIARAVGR